MNIDDDRFLTMYNLCDHKSRLRFLSK